jgi:small subunit ribosomal protein S11
MNNSCIIHINSTLNNTILVAMDGKKKTITVRSLGNVVKKRGKRSVSNGALLVGESIAKTLLEKGYTECQLLVKGFGSGRESAIQGISSSNLGVSEIIDITRVPHNGCRPPKRRRI